MSAWIATMQLERDLLLFRGMVFASWSAWFPWNRAFWQRSPLLPWHYPAWRQSKFLPWNRVFWRQSKFLPWNRVFWRQWQFLPWNWAFWSDPEWQDYALLNIALWFPNKLLFGVVVIFAGDLIWLVLLESAAWDLTVFFIFRSRQKKEEVRVGTCSGSFKRLSGTALSFLFHKGLTTLLITRYMGTGLADYALITAIQAVVGVIENPVWFFFTKYILRGRKIKHLPLVAWQRLRAETEMV
ncbi:MAG TPA: hypothetical protein VG964_02840 [Candidatus Saccharimonadales bacterium]|nr:hypothetical protein [Candidatus Saccharimonadales bacterium]